MWMGGRCEMVDRPLWCFCMPRCLGCVSRKMQGRSLGGTCLLFRFVEMFSLKKRTSSFPPVSSYEIEPHPQAPVTEVLVF